MHIGLIIVFIAGLALLLSWLFPYAVGNTDQQMRLAYLAALLLLVGGGSGLLRRMTVSQALKSILMWIGIILLLVFFYELATYIKEQIT